MGGNEEQGGGRSFASSEQGYPHNPSAANTGPTAQKVARTAHKWFLVFDELDFILLLSFVHKPQTISTTTQPTSSSRRPLRHHNPTYYLHSCLTPQSTPTHPPPTHPQPVTMKVRRGAKKIRLQGKRQNQSKFIKPKAGMHSVVQPLWQGKQSVRNNLARLGVSDDPNRAVSKMSSAASTTTPATTTDTEALFSLPPVEQRDRNPRRRLMSEEDQSYIVKLLAEYGEDFKVSVRVQLSFKGGFGACGYLCCCHQSIMALSCPLPSPLLCVPLLPSSFSSLSNPKPAPHS